MDQITSLTPLTTTVFSEPTIETVPRLSFLEATKLRAAKIQTANSLS